MVDTSPSDPNLTAIYEMLRSGRESANGALSLLRQPSTGDHLISAIGHAMSVLSSINHSLSVLSSCEQEISSHAPTRSSHSGTGRGGRRSADFLLGVSDLKHRHKNSWTRMTPILIDDGYAWRKYGQKPISNTKFPRSYYKCTHSPRCDALKQVQMIDDEPPLYRITYTRHHTCNNGATNFTYMDERTTNTCSSSSSSSSTVINFASKNIEEIKPQSTKQYKRPFSTHIWSSVKEEDDASESKFVPPADYQVAMSSLDHAKNSQIGEYLQMDEAPTSLETVSNGFDESSFSIESFMNQYNYDVMPSLNFM